MQAVKRSWTGAARFPAASTFRSSVCSSGPTLRSSRASAPRWRSSLVSGYLRPQSQYLHISRARCAGYSTAAQQVTQHDQEDSITSGGPPTTFKQLSEHGLVAQSLVDTLVDRMRMTNLTDVQSLTIAKALTGCDMVAQARTGTGKTLAFLIPTVQNIINQLPKLQEGAHRFGNAGNDIRAIIISPTRELAEQIAAEARRLVQGTGITVRTAVGGSSKRQGLRLIHESCNILVGTPGRLKDIFSDHIEGVQAPNLSILVLDEADRLLEQGFEQEIREIQRLLPDKSLVDRQTLLYSATITREIMPVVRSTMKKGFELVRTVQEGEDLTHERVPQKLVNVGSLANQTLALAELCLREIDNATPERPFKAIVFYSTLNDVALVSQALSKLRPPRTGESRPGIPFSTQIIGLSSRLSQMQRTQNAQAFKNASSAILLSSDVAARGMDFPGVTHVIQMGLPPTEEQYVHRIGRTARAGQSGEAWLLVAKLEVNGVRTKLPRMPLRADQSLLSPKIDPENGSDVPASLQPLSDRLKQCFNSIDDDLKLESYKTTLGLFGQISNRQAVADAVNARATHEFGLARLPPISQSRAAKLGFLNVRGIQLGRELSGRGISRSSSGGGRPRSPYMPNERNRQERRDPSFKPYGVGRTSRRDGRDTRRSERQYSL